MIPIILGYRNPEGPVGILPYGGPEGSHMQIKNVAAN